MSENIPAIVPELLRDRFVRAYKHNRVILFHASCGCGKTVVAQELLKQYDTHYLSAGDDNFSLSQADNGCKVLILDDLHLLKSGEDKAALCEMIRTQMIRIHRNKHFVLLSRGAIPGWLMPFQLSGMLEAFDMADLMLDKNSIQKLAKVYGISLTPAEIGAIQNDTKGYPVVLAILFQQLSKGGRYCQAALNEGKRDLFRYFDEMIYRPFEKPVRQLLVKVAPFEPIHTELAMLVSGDSHAGELLAQLQQDSSMFLPGAPDLLVLRPIFREFLMWKLAQELDGEEQKTLFSRAGLYYELKDERKSALDCYFRVGDQRKISELLIKNAEQHVGIGQYLEMEQYYFAMPKEDILRSPTLIAGMSMLCSLLMDFEQSDRWYAALQDYAMRRKKSDSEYKDAQNRLAYLDIALPQRGSTGLYGVITKVFHAMSDKKLKLPAVSMTSTLPSILNGGKDFTVWTKQDTVICAALRKPSELILGRDGVGLMDCVLCESFFEKDADYRPKLLTVLMRLSDIQRNGSPDVEFAAVGLLARAQLAEGQAHDARETVENLRSRFIEMGETRFIPNMDALLCRIQMQQGDMVALCRWLKEKAPKDDLRIWVLHRYQYLTKAMALIANGEEAHARIILARLLPYVERCGRILDEIAIRLLSALCYFRTGNPLWQEELSQMLNLTCEYRYIRPVAEYGTAVLPLLTASHWRKDTVYLETLIAAVRIQAVNYPLFLKPEAKLTEPLTAAEQQVLKLLCHNMSNQEIGDVLGIQLATVKVHVGRVLKKLKVSRRSEAKEAAEQLGLF